MLQEKEVVSKKNLQIDLFLQRMYICIQKWAQVLQNIKMPTKPNDNRNSWLKTGNQKLKLSFATTIHPTRLECKQQFKCSNNDNNHNYEMSMIYTNYKEIAENVRWLGDARRQMVIQYSSSADVMITTMIFNLPNNKNTWTWRAEGISNANNNEQKDENLSRALSPTPTSTWDIINN